MGARLFLPSPIWRRTHVWTSGRGCPRCAKQRQVHGPLLARSEDGSAPARPHGPRVVDLAELEGRVGGLDADRDKERPVPASVHGGRVPSRFRASRPSVSQRARTVLTRCGRSPRGPAQPDTSRPAETARRNALAQRERLIQRGLWMHQRSQSADSTGATSGFGRGCPGLEECGIRRVQPRIGGEACASKLPLPASRGQSAVRRGQ
jgi:hypothetical protein